MAFRVAELVGFQDVAFHSLGRRFEVSDLDPNPRMLLRGGSDRVRCGEGQHSQPALNPETLVSLAEGPLGSLAECRQCILYSIRSVRSSTEVSGKERPSGRVELLVQG